MSKTKNNVIESPVKALLHKRYCRCQAEMFDTEPTVFKCGDIETAVPDRTIPISELWSRFVRGENIADQRMSKPLYNPIENNPWKKKGLDLADTPQIVRETQALKAQAEQQASEEIAASRQAKEDSKAQVVQQPQEVIPAAE